MDGIKFERSVAKEFEFEMGTCRRIKIERVSLPLLIYSYTVGPLPSPDLFVSLTHVFPKSGDERHKRG